MAKSIFKRRSETGAEMSFIDHLEALRWHIMRALMAILIGAVVVFVKMDFFFGKVVMGPADKDFITYRALCKFSHWVGMGDAMCMDEINLKLISTQMSSQFMMSFTIAFVGGFIIAFPYVFWEFWKFIRPALTEKEIKKTGGMIFWVSVLFFTGVAFGYFLIAPYTVNFFASYTLSPMIANTFTVADYIDNIVSLVVGAGVLFQLPLAVYFLAKIGLVTAQFLRTYRKFAVVVILILAAVITPPDVLSQLIVTVPLWFLYEISISIAARVNKKDEFLVKPTDEWS
ncbi:twin-arginine translocase subunit TatC [Flavihumibacter cheonanensis]|jgi:sec-independent protein translocase protein TatC|uniref:twin-arginine translocase subunit TatC n=1 Tax=Flavihumibacter cheonanensis TaxID=1442385 RepID=UPI001EF794FE|nr:twin-arginine translocase subunit TatC [Flavihumibacter cheonanensis]MCG7752836.1 twin-arginine translocase subunit TatC [Flavihumibacter cheonanensis]